MATKPTRPQVQASEKLAGALLLIAEAARLDGRGPLGPAGLAEVARLAARASSAFDLDAILAIALEGRGRALGLRAGTAELLTLVEGEVEPLASLLLGDDDFKALVEKAEAALGEV